MNKDSLLHAFCMKEDANLDRGEITFSEDVTASSLFLCLKSFLKVGCSTLL
jgi:hypothetical protein